MNAPLPQPAAPAIEEEPLNPRQLAFARELGIARAQGGREEAVTAAYAAAGYTADRANARRLAADPRVKRIADQMCAEALEVAGLHIQYLQAKALEMLHASPTKILRAIKAHAIASRPMADISQEERDELDAALDAITWPLSEFKIDKDGIIGIKLPDKKALIEMLAKQLGVGQDNQTANFLTLEQLVLQSYAQQKPGDAAKDITPAPANASPSDNKEDRQ